MPNIFPFSCPLSTSCIGCINHSQCPHHLIRQGARTGQANPKSFPGLHINVSYSEIFHWLLLALQILIVSLPHYYVRNDAILRCLAHCCCWTWTIRKEWRARGALHSGHPVAKVAATCSDLLLVIIERRASNRMPDPTAAIQQLSLEVGWR